MLNVLHFTSYSGYNTLFVDLAKFINREKIELRLGSLSPPGELQEDMRAAGIDAFALGCTRRSEYPKAVIRLAGLLRKHRIDVVHTHLVDASLVGLMAARLCGIPVRVMTRHHSNESLLYNSRRALAVDKLLSKHLAQETFAISKHVRRVLMETDGVSEKKIAMVPNGYDWDRIQSSDEAALAIRREFGLEDATVLCTVSRLVWTKGHEYLFQAFASVADRLPSNTRMLIVGSGPEEEQIRNVANKLGIADRTIFTGYRSDVYDFMMAADLYVHPSLHEAQSGAIVEAMALCKPVVATSVGAGEEIVLPNQTGWLVPPRDSATLAESICAALENPQQAGEYARNGQQLVRSIYPIQNMIRGYQAVYARHLPGEARRALEA
jgi:glycosyltransferase involved in cell wall biosynthesis